MFRRIIYFLLFLVSSLCYATANEQLSPVLNFSDLISGPDIGIKDNLGSGAIVTLWGQNLGFERGNSRVIFKDNKGNILDVAYTYYWKPANGKLPGGPANLYKSHRMTEIAVSIPASSPGLGELYILKQITDSKTKKTLEVSSNALPFTVRDGSIYHVKHNGNNKTGQGSFIQPWATVSRLSSKARKKIKAGDIIYLHHGVKEMNGKNGKNKHIGLYLSGHSASAEKQTALIAYPNSKVLAQANNKGMGFYRSSGIVVSKFTVKVGNYDTPLNNATLPKNTDAVGIRTTRFGRIIGNEITQIEGRCVSGMQGAINGNARAYDAVSDVKILGNYVHDWGCDQSSHFGHVFYLSNRSNGKRDVIAWQYGWNYLLNNKSKNGLHNYDESFSGKCGNVVGNLIINDNVVDSQKGLGISIGVNNKEVCWHNKIDIYNNILINVGLGPPDEHGVNSSAIRILDNGLKSKINIYNNTVYNWATNTNQGQKSALDIRGKQDNISVNITNNMFYTEKNSYFESTDKHLKDNISGTNNLWYSTSSLQPQYIAIPTWDSKPIKRDPLLKYSSGSLYFTNSSAPLLKGVSLNLERDIYGIIRSKQPTVGAIELSH